MDNRIYWVWLQQALGAGSDYSGAVLRAFDGAQEVYKAKPQDLELLALPAEVIKRLGEKSLHAARAIYKQTLKAGDWLLTPDDARYPALLRGIYNPPLVLYARGNMPDLEVRPALAMVGTRDASRAGCDMAVQLAAGVAAAGMTVISGGAVGIDRAAHGGALLAKGSTVAVLACGLNVEYPLENTPLRRNILKGGGALVTEYPPDTRPTRSCFHVRNRLISGMAYGVCVVEAPVQSGSLITAHMGRDQGRDVFAVPGAVDNAAYAGSNALIREGAQLVRNVTEILQEYADRFPGLLDPYAAERTWTREELESVLSGLLRPERPDAPLRPDRPETAAPSTGRKPPARRWGRSPRPDDHRDSRGNGRSAVPQAPADERSAGKTASVRPHPPVPVQPLSADAARVRAALTEQWQPVDVVAVKAALSIPQTYAALTELELTGSVSSAAGGQYALTSDKS